MLKFGSFTHSWLLGDIWFPSLVIRLCSSHRPGKCTSKIDPINEEVAHKKAVMSRSIYEKTSPEVLFSQEPLSKRLVFSTLYSLAFFA